MVVIIKRGMSRQRIRALMNRLRAAPMKHRKPVDVYQLIDMLKWDEDPVELQRKWRDEW